MAMKSIALITVLVVVLAATQAEAQLTIPRIPVFNIIGNVSCSLNGSVIVNGTIPTPPFPNALVQLSCNGIVRGVAITNARGMFSFFATGILNSLSNLLQSCRVVLVTPLSTCNATLPSTGNLQAPLQFVNSTLIGLLNVTTVTTGSFIRV